MKLPDEVEAAGGLEEWKNTEDEDPARWLHRMWFALMIAEAALSTYRELT